MRAAAFLVFLAAGLAAGAAQAQNRVPAEDRILPWSGAVPSCDEPAVLGKIQRDFGWREDKYWFSGLQIVGYERVRPVAYRPWGSEFIPRRYCTGQALVSDGLKVRKRQVDYVIREGLGFIGASWGLEWCVAGLDRHWNDAPECRMNRP